MQYQFTLIRTADLLDDLAAAIDEVRASSARDNAPWMVALDKAWDYILQTDTLHYDLAANAVRVESATEPGRFYEANGICECKAATKGAGICWHRACARLIARSLDVGAARELASLAAELSQDARDAGASWYAADIAERGASARLPGLLAYALEWDAVSAAQRTAHA